MSSDLSIFAARLREFIGICASEPEFANPDIDPQLRDYYDAQFNGMALVLSALQFTHNATYRKICEARGIFPNQLSHWTQIPVVPASAFKELEVTCLTPTERLRTFHSSGTTDQRPSRHFHSSESMGVYEASLWPWFKAHMLPDIGDAHLVFLVPPPSQAPNSSLVHMLEVVRRELNSPASAFSGNVGADGSWTLDGGKVGRDFSEAITTGRPVLVCGTAFSFVHLVDYCAESNFRFQLPAGSRVMETGGYKGRSRSMPKPDLHALISDRLGILPHHIVCEYGMSELSSQAYDLKIQSASDNVPVGTRLFELPPWARAQIVSPETGRDVAEGETGLLRLFDLANVFSVMAIQTEDLAIRRGNTFELIGRTEVAEPRGCSLMSGESSSSRPLAKP